MHRVKWPASPVTYLKTVSRTFIHVRAIKLILLSLPILFTDKDDHTRVELNKKPDVEGSDYINASFIDVSIFNHYNSWIHKIQGYREKKRVYVAAQGNFILLKLATDQI